MLKAQICWLILGIAIIIMLVPINGIKVMNKINVLVSD